MLHVGISACSLVTAGYKAVPYDYKPHQARVLDWKAVVHARQQVLSKGLGTACHHQLPPPSLH